MSAYLKRGNGLRLFGAAVLGFVLLALVASLGPAKPVAAAFPGGNGKLVFQSYRNSNWDIYVVNPDGSELTRLTTAPQIDQHPAWSPDGTKIAFESLRDGATAEIYVMDAGGANQMRLTVNSVNDMDPAWSPDGTKIVFTSVRDGNNELYVMDSATGGNARRLTASSSNDGMAAWSPDGTKIAFHSDRGANAMDVYLLDPTTLAVTQVTNNIDWDWAAEWSPDGSKIAFNRGRSLVNQDVFVIDANGQNQVNVTNNAKIDYGPAWSPDGAKIAFVRGSTGGNDDSIFIMDADGRNQVALNLGVGINRSPDWQRLNVAPVASDDAYSVEEDQTLVTFVSVLANDSDANRDMLQAVWAGGPEHGSLMPYQDGTFTYSPEANYFGVDSFIYFANDGKVDSNTALVTITVTPANDPPAAYDDAYTVGENEVLTVAATGVLSNDTDQENNPLAAILVDSPSYGVLALNPDGSFSYTPNDRYVGPDSFTYRVSDGQAESNLAAVHLTVEPRLADLTVYKHTDPDGSTQRFAFTGMGGFSLVDGESARFDALSPGAFTISEAALSHWALTDIACDGGVWARDGRGLTITLAAGQDIGCTFYNTRTNAAPVATNDGASTLEDTAVSINVLGNDADADGDALAVALDAAPANGTAVLQPDGSFAYTPNPDWNGTDSFSYTVTDPEGIAATAAVTVQVQPVNDTPLVNSDSAATDEDLPVAIAVLDNDQDAADGDPAGEFLALADVTTPQHGSAVIVGRLVTYTPAPDFNGEDQFSYTACDTADLCAVASVAVVVGGTNDAPVAVPDEGTTAEDTPVSLDVLGNDHDIDGDALSAVLISGPAHGALSLVGNAFDYAPDADWYGEDGFTYQATDGQLASEVVQVTIVVTAVNDAPVAAADSGETTTANAITVAVLANDSDVEGDALNVVAVTPGANGSVVANPDGTVTYTRNPGFNGSDTFTYTASDGNGGEAVGQVSVQITPDLNLPPDVDLGENVEIAPDATIGGDVTIGDNAVVETGATVQTGAEVGDNAIIASDAMVGQGVTVGDNSTVGAGSEVKAGSDIGSGATLAPDVVINQNVSVGAGFTAGTNAMLMQDVTLGANVVLGADVKLGKGVVIGDNVSIGDYTQVKDYTTIGYRTTIGRNCLIKRYVRIGHDVRIGDGRTLNDNAVVPDGTTIP